MANKFTTAAQEIIFAKLNGNLTGCAVFDTAPYQPEGAPNDAFPYCLIGDATISPFDTDDTLGGIVTVTIHFWSRAKGAKQVKGLMDEAYSLLHRASISKVGYNVLDCLFEFGESMDDPDGVTKHGVQRYRLTIQAAA